MNDVIIKELNNTIEKIKLEILEKQKHLNNLIDQYQELSKIEIEEN